MKISELLRLKTTRSYEFFPPKEVAQEGVLFDSIVHLKSFPPDFVSITYGAGGSTRDKTFAWTQTLTNEHKFNTMMHLTCYGNTPETIVDTCKQLMNAGIENVLALRGDMPQNATAMPKAFSYASELIAHIRAKCPNICIGGAGYPEKHPQAADVNADTLAAKAKADAGASFLVTQLFFDNNVFYKYLDRLHSAGVHLPVVAGLMPITSYKQVARFIDMCGTAIPSKLVERLEKASAIDAAKIGEEHALLQSRELLERGVNGLHYYTLNKSETTFNILSRL
ncbi:methylenetetrahydrofolate reductase [NAD(P)H] [Deferribacterales bacterium RsTz2092]|nr:methylenetetrahydrofolate reductase [Deferribacterales bacterium]